MPRNKGTRKLGKRPEPGPTMAPSFRQHEPRVLVELPPSPRDLARFLVPGENDYFRCYKLGGCTVLVTRERGRWHLSLANPVRYPTWDELAEARYRILPGDVCVAMLLPPLDQYVNAHEFCFHLHEIDDPEGGGQ